MRDLPEQRVGVWAWNDSSRETHVRFLGKGGAAEIEDAVREQLPAGIEGAWMSQVHSATVLEAQCGSSGRGDALVTDRRGIALAVVTADCVPILLSAPNTIAAIHAGWRGVAQRIVPQTLARIEGRAEAIVAWVGPAIGRCCYEVGADVAERVAAVSAANVVTPGKRGRPHLDLSAAVVSQLEEGGVSEIRALERCTRCERESLWSYRREGPGAGRNLALIWRA